MKLGVGLLNNPFSIISAISSPIMPKDKHPSHEPEVNILTTNQFSPLEEEEDDDVVFIRNNDKELRLVDLLIISDSHGRAIQPQKMYKTKETHIKILDKGKKTLDGAIDFLQSSNMMGKQTLLLVGSNDVSAKSAPEVYRKFQRLCDVFLQEFPSCELNIMPVLPRPYNDRYNREATALNDRLCSMEMRNVSIIPDIGIRESDVNLFNIDNVHLTQDGNIKLVRAIKTHLNPKLGLPAYKTYSRDTNELLKDNISTRGNNSYSQTRRQRPNDQRQFRRRDEANEKRDLICRLLGI